MSTKNVTIFLSGLLIVLFTVPNQSFAQWGIGASYEIRNEEPENGFGLRIERGILQKLPIVDLGLRAHFSYFSDENQVTQSGLSFSQEVTDYDYGVTAVGGVSVGLVKPYVGLGIGSNTIDVDVKDVPQNVQATGASESKFYWNALAGAQVSIIPKLKPFVEYRFSKLGESPFDGGGTTVPDDDNGRIIFGVLLTF